MPLLNYTTAVPATRTVVEVQATLAGAGATHVMVKYGDTKFPVAIAFGLKTAAGVRSFVLPVDPDPVFKVLARQKVDRRYQNLAQAQRVAWRIVKDWVEAQVALMSTGMVSMDEVMLPYMVTGPEGQTLYQVYRAKGALELEQGKEPT
jgi:hypothetical protein